MSRQAKITIIVIAAVGGFFVLVCGGIGALIYMGLRQQFEEPTDIRVWVVSPDRVRTGEAFTIEVHVANDARRAQVIDSIDVYDTYLEGISIQSSQPAWRNSSHVFDFVTYDFQHSILADSEQVVTFQAKALQPGDFSGDFDVCINREVSFMTQVVRTIVDDGNQADP